jgi:hypothetical protein
VWALAAIATAEGFVQAAVGKLLLWMLGAACWQDVFSSQRRANSKQLSAQQHRVSGLAESQASWQPQEHA